MSAKDPSDRALIARVAAHTRWAKEPDRDAATQSARRGLEAKWEREVDPTGSLPPEERARRVSSLRSAHMQRMTLLSAQKRRARKEAA